MTAFRVLLTSFLIALSAVNATELFPGGTPTTITGIASPADEPVRVVPIDATTMLVGDRASATIWLVNRSGAVIKTVYTIPSSRLANVVGTLAGMQDFILDREFSTGSPYLYVAYTSSEKALNLDRIYLGADFTSGTIVPLLSAGEVPINAQARLAQRSDGTILMTTGSFDTPSPMAPALRVGKMLNCTRNGEPVAAISPTADPFVFASGFRNPLSVAVVTSDNPTMNDRIYEVEYGAAGADEINLVRFAGNYGWPRRGGFCSTFSGSDVCPLGTSNQGPSSVAWYESAALPELNGRLLVGLADDSRLGILSLASDGITIVENNPAMGYDNTLEFNERNTINIDGSPVSMRIHNIAVDAEGRVYLSMRSRVVGQKGRIVVIENPLLHGTTSIHGENSVSALRMHPNPTRDDVAVTIPESLGLVRRIVILDAMGRIAAMMDVDGRSGTITLGVGHLSTSMYNVLIHGSKGTAYGRLIRE